MELILGLDVGATTSRCLVATTDGERLGYGEASGGNPVAHGAERAFEAIAGAVPRALAGVPPDQVATAVVGLAGVSLLADPDTAARFSAMWADAGLRCRYRLVGDTLVAYAAGTAEPDGSVLIAGTGSNAARIRNRRQVRFGGGHGWLLSDEGSAFWLGREAVRAALSVADGWAPAGELTRLVLHRLTGSAGIAADPRETAAAIVNAAHAGPPVGLAALAPLVGLAAAAGDAAAVDIVAAAAAHLVETVARVRDSDERTPIVLAGALLIADTPVAAAVHTALAERWPAAELRTARDGAAGAAWLAALDLPDPPDAAALHARLLAS